MVLYSTMEEPWSKRKEIRKNEKRAGDKERGGGHGVASSPCASHAQTPRGAPSHLGGKAKLVRVGRDGRDAGHGEVKVGEVKASLAHKGDLEMNKRGQEKKKRA